MQKTVWHGLSALAKVALIVAGVPLALVRLWRVAPLPQPLASLGALSALSTWVHLVIVGVGALWVVATVTLAHELCNAFRQVEEATPRSRSSRWAGQIAGLLLLASSGALLASSLEHAGTTAAVHTAPRARLAGRATTRAPVVPAVPRRVRELALLGAGVLTSAALVRRARQLRRIGESLRLAGERRPGADLEAIAYETMLRHFGDPTILDSIETANRLLWQVCAAGSRPRPEVRLLRCGREGIEILLDEPLPDAPAPFRVRSEGRWWLLEPTACRQAASGVRGAGRYLPYLVPVGDDEDASYLVVLGPGRRLGILGARAAVAEVNAGILLGLRTLPWAEELDIELVGLAPPPPSERAYQLHSSSLETLRELARRSPVDRDRLDSTWQRAPLGVLAPGAALDRHDLAEVNAAMGLLVAEEAGTETLVLSDDRALLSPFAIELHPPALHATSAQLADALLAGASTPPVPPRTPPLAPVTPPHSLAPVGARELSVLGVRARLSGPGAPVEEDRRRVCELVAYLLLHNRRATQDEIGRALFLAQPPAPARVENLCSVARAVLGTSPTGRSFLSPAIGATYELADEVSCDWLRFVEAHERARSCHGDIARALLADALALVTGPPLVAEPVGYAWFEAGDFREQITAAVVDAAHQLACLEFAAGNRTGARRAIDTASLLEPCSEILARDLMVLAESAHDRAALDEAFLGLERGLLELGVEPSAATIALYESLRSEIARSATT